MRINGLADMSQDQLDYLHANMSVLQSGALDRKVHTKIYELVTRSVTRADKDELVALFSILGCTAGCFLITGMPAPFQVSSCSIPCLLCILLL